MNSADQEQHEKELELIWNSPPGLWGWLRTVNQTGVGRRYITTAIIFFLLAGVLGLLIRTQLAYPEYDLLSPELYNQIFTVHGITMMFLFAIPIMEGVAIYFVPLMIGTRDLCFPRLTAFSYFVFLIGGVFLWVTFLMGLGPDVGWFNYVPMASKTYSPGIPIDIYVTVITFIEISALAAAVELICTILKQRAPGMSLARTPPLVWSILVMAFMIVFAMPGVIVGSVMLALDRLVGTSFFIVERAGDSLLWQHLFWWFGHPDVYIAFVPATGIISSVLPTFCGRPLYAYRAVIASIVTIGMISFGLWVHHMFTTGIPLHASSFFSAASALIAIPTGVQIYAWIATIWGGKPQFKTPFLYCLGFIITFLAGGLTGFMVAIVPFDLQVHDSYFVVAHFHYVLIGGAVFPLLAGYYYWWPKYTGRMLSDTMGKIAFAIIFIGFHLTFFPMHELGFLGMPRRIYTYLTGLGWDSLNLLSTAGAYLLGSGFLVILLSSIWSYFRGISAGNNPWGATTLEWAALSPPPSHNFGCFPLIKDLAPISRENKELTPAITGIQTNRREVLITTVDAAEPQAVIVLPGPTIWPFAASLSTAVLFIGCIYDPWWFVWGFLATFVTLTGWLWVKKPWNGE